MKKQGFIVSMIGIFAVLVLVGGGCAKTNAPAGSAEAEFGKISDAVASGQKVVCHVTIEDESETFETTYWIKGDDMRGEIDMGGMKQTFIQDGEDLYTSADAFGAEECDWFLAPEAEDVEYDSDYEGSEYEDFDYEQYEDNTMYTVDCNKENFSNSLLKADGNICNMDDMFGSMMEGLDMEDFDFEM